MRKLALVTALWGLSTAGCLKDIIPYHQGTGGGGSSPADLATNGPDDAGLAPAGDDAAPPDDGGTAFNLTIEAETGTLTAPMATMTDPNVAGLQYIAVPPAGVGGKAVFTFDVPRAGSYAIWGRVIGPADANNSFHVSIDADTIDNDPTDGTSTIWDLPISTTWTMNRVNMRNSATPTNVDQVYMLSAGTHTLYLNEREDSTQLDRLLITDDLTTIPAN